MDMPITTAVNALRNLLVFRNTSARLLADLVWKAIDNGQVSPLPEERDLGISDAALVVALEGRAYLSSTAGGPSELERSRAGGILLGPGEAIVTDQATRLDMILYARAAGGDEARILWVTQTDLRDSMEASFSLARSVDPVAGATLPGMTGPGGDVAHLIWISVEPGLVVSLESAARLLAAAIAGQFQEKAALVIVDRPGLRVLAWREGAFVQVPFTFRPGEPLESQVLAALEARSTDVYHLLFLRPDPPNDVIPDEFQALRFHRVVYLASRLPEGAPSGYVSRLKEGAHNKVEASSPYYSSFVPVVVGRPTAVEQDSAPLPVRLATRLAAAVGWLFRDSLRSGEVDGKDASSWRMRRDVVSLDLNGKWEDLLAQGSTKTWARATTNRQVGLALSGGGASSYRLVQLLEGLDAKGLPVDMVSGVSGGSLLGAYYCKEGPKKGLAHAVQMGVPFQAIAIGSVFCSRLIEWVIDLDLGTSQVSQLDVRFLPLATALQRKTPPRPHIFKEGTLGEAVRASGSLPGLIGPTQKNGRRYNDGAAASLVPARILKDHGADLIFAFNSIPGPALSNPLEVWPCHVGDFLYWWTPVGRLVDVWVSGAFMLQRASKDAGRDANHMVEAAPQKAPLLEILQFWRAASIAQDWDPQTLEKHLNRCMAHYHAFVAGVPVAPGPSPGNHP
jgi:hypothetical protein